MTASWAISLDHWSTPVSLSRAGSRMPVRLVEGEPTTHQPRREELTAAIDELADISRESADMLRRLLAATFERPYLDLDAVASLADSARRLRHLGEDATMLHDSARLLSGLEEHASTLHGAARMLRGLETHAASLHEAADRLRGLRLAGTVGKIADLDDTAHRLSALATKWAGWEQTVSRMERAANSLDDYDPVIHVDHPQRWRFFWRGAACGAAAVLLIVILVVTRLPQ